MMLQKQKGFTIIELMFALTFLSFLLVFIVTSTIQTMRTYNKGITFKSVNQSGRSILDQMSRDIGQSVTPVVYKDPAGILRGMLCTQSVAYIWNTIYAPTSLLSVERNKYSVSDPKQPYLYLVRTNDRTHCNATDQGWSPDTKRTGVYQTTELLSDQASVTKIDLTKITPKLYLLELGLGSADTSGYESPGSTVCSSNDAVGQFCASAEFRTYIYVPNGN
ncbi:MAG: type II secretion system protein [Candidatus Saccharimonadales bacterium]